MLGEESPVELVPAVQASRAQQSCQGNAETPLDGQSETWRREGRAAAPVLLISATVPGKLCFSGGWGGSVLNGGHHPHPRSVTFPAKPPPPRVGVWNLFPSAGLSFGLGRWPHQEAALLHDWGHFGGGGEEPLAAERPPLHTARNPVPEPTTWAEEKRHGPYPVPEPTAWAGTLSRIPCHRVPLAAPGAPQEPEPFGLQLVPVRQPWPGRASGARQVSARGGGQQPLEPEAKLLLQRLGSLVEEGAKVGARQPSCFQASPAREALSQGP